MAVPVSQASLMRSEALKGVPFRPPWAQGHPCAKLHGWPSCRARPMLPPASPGRVTAHWPGHLTLAPVSPLNLRTGTHHSLWTAWPQLHGALKPSARPLWALPRDALVGAESAARSPHLSPKCPGISRSSLPSATRALLWHELRGWLSQPHLSSLHFLSLASTCWCCYRAEL